MRVIKRALIDAAVNLFADAATESLPQQSQAPSEQSAGGKGDLGAGSTSDALLTISSRSIVVV